jgi:atypical dual specificity phosphatase
VQQSHTRLALQLQSIRQFIARCLQSFRQLAVVRRPRVDQTIGDRTAIDPPQHIPQPKTAEADFKPEPPPIAQPRFDPASFDNFDSSSPDGTSRYPQVERAASVPRTHPHSSKDKASNQRKSRPQRSRHARIDWVIPGKLAVGGLPRSPLALTLVEHRIKVVLSVCPESEGHLPKAIRQGFRCLRVPLTDSRSVLPLDPFDLGEAVDLIQWNLNKQMPVYVHCLAGMERSPTVCLAYLCRYQQFDLLDALGWLRHVHPATRITGAQLSSVRHYLQSLGPELPIATDGASGS